MEKASITIRPANDDFRVKLDALRLVNDFAALGFGSRVAFMAIVSHYFPKYKEGKFKSKLSNWYYSRLTDETMNSEIETVLEKLRHE